MRTFLALFCFVISSSIIAADYKVPVLYRYKDAEGKVVLNSVLPGEFAGKGYDVLNMKGQVLEKVPPKLSQEELRARAAAMDEEAREQLRKVEQEKRDRELKRLYGTGQDAARTRDRQIQALDLQKDYVKSNIIQLKGKLNLELEKAADLERAGQPVNDVLKEDIASLNKQIEAAEATISKYEEDQQKLRAEYDEILQRFAEMENRDTRKKIEQESAKKKKEETESKDKEEKPSEG